MFKVWVQSGPSRCCGVLRKATADASRAITRLCRLPALGVCHVTALAAAYEQPAEAGADGRYAWAEVGPLSSRKQKQSACTTTYRVCNPVKVHHRSGQACLG